MSTQVPQYLKDYCRKLNSALDTEIAQARQNVPAMYVWSGKIVGNISGGIVHQFRCNGNLFLVEDAPALVTIEGREVGGRVISCADGILKIILPTTEVADIDKAQLYCRDWEQLELLQKAVNKLERGAGRNYYSAARIAGANVVSSLPPTATRPTWVLGLDESQKKAVSSLLNQNVGFVWGTSGSGKSEVLCRMAAIGYRLNKRVLYVTADNWAADDISARLAQRLSGDRHFISNSALVRVGGYTRFDLPVSLRQGTSLEGVITQRRRALEAQYKRELALVEKGQIKTKDIEEFRSHIDNLDTTAIMTTPLVVATATQTLFHELGEFDWVICDQSELLNAAQTLYVSSLGGEKAIFAGDFRQLGPVIQTREEESRALLEKDALTSSGSRAFLSDGQVPSNLSILRHQYRQGPVLSQIVNSVAYQDFPIQSSPTPNEDNFPFGQEEVFFIDTSSLANEQTNTSRRNPLHQLLIEGLLKEMAMSGYFGEETLDKGEPDRVGIVSPYKEQVESYEKSLEELHLGHPMVSAMTCHRLQGRHGKDTIILDLTDGPGGKRPSMFLTGSGLDDLGTRLLNVAVSHTRRHLIVIGDFNYLAGTLPAQSSTMRLIQNAKSLGKAISWQHLVNRAKEAKTTSSREF